MSNCSLPPNATIRDAIGVIESAKKTIAVVLDHRHEIIGTISDGDIRRALLAGSSLESPVTVAVHRHPLTATVGLPAAQLLEFLETSNLEAMPLVDAAGTYQGVVHKSELTGRPLVARGGWFSAAIVMAGGEGLRLRPLTASTPKPMIDVGGVPLLERQIACLRRAGIYRIFLSINYLGHLIEKHFGDGAEFGVQIEYLREPKRMGTGGALSLLPDDLSGDLLVINGDIVTRSDFNRLGAFHREHRACITLGAIHHHVDIPFGVIIADGVHVSALREKPSQQFLCNAGIYALSSEALGLVPVDSFLDMTDLVEIALGQGKEVVIFPIYEYWSDIGTVRDLERVRQHVEASE